MTSVQFRSTTAMLLRRLGGRRAGRLVGVRYALCGGRDTVLRRAWPVGTVREDRAPTAVYCRTELAGEPSGADGRTAAVSCAQWGAAEEEKKAVVLVMRFCVKFNRPFRSLSSIACCIYLT